MYGFIRATNNFFRKIEDDHVNAFSAQAAFFVIISFFPFVMFLLTLLKYINLDYEQLNKVFTDVFPGTMSEMLIEILEEIENDATGTLTFVSIVATLWSSSMGMMAVIRGLNGVYAHKESRKYITLRFWSIVYTLVFAGMIIIILVVFVFGNRITAFFKTKVPILFEYALLVTSIRTVLGLGVLFFFFLFIYTLVPNRKTNIITEMPGALITSVGWMGFSYFFSFYIDNMSNFSSTYGSLTAVVLCMLWLFSCMYIMFVGAEINAELQKMEIKGKLGKLLRKKGK